MCTCGECVAEQQLDGDDGPVDSLVMPYRDSCFSISSYAGGANKYGLYAYLEMTDAIHEYPPEGAPVKVVESRKVRFVRVDLFQAMLNMEYEDRKRLIDELAPDTPEVDEVDLGLMLMVYSGKSAGSQR